MVTRKDKKSVKMAKKGGTNWRHKHSLPRDHVVIQPEKDDKK